MPRSRRPPKPTFGIGEWFGRSFVNLTPGQRQEFIQPARLKRMRNRPPDHPRCPARQAESPGERCNKPGGVCSLRLYQQTDDQQVVSPPGLITLCPERFKEGGKVVQWVGEHLLGHQAPLVAVEVEFLERMGLNDEAGGDRAVGKIDMVLVHPDMASVWCALEMQAVYFSGAAMSEDFNRIAGHQGPGLPFPSGRRHPDFRSSGPKRLMPQLQIKVPTLRRWGKKMVVVVDQDFMRAMGPMEDERNPITHISNCDIVWVIVRYAETEGHDATLELGEIRYTTLERAVEGLTAGKPVSLDEFERRIIQKLG